MIHNDLDFSCYEIHQHDGKQTCCLLLTLLSLFHGYEEVSEKSSLIFSVVSSPFKIYLLSLLEFVRSFFVAIFWQQEVNFLCYMNSPFISSKYGLTFLVYYSIESFSLPLLLYSVDLPSLISCFRFIRVRCYWPRSWHKCESSSWSSY